MSPLPAPPRILVADDQIAVREALRILLVREGYEVHFATSPEGTLRAVREADPDLVLLDLNYSRDTTSGREGLDLIAELARLEGAPAVVVMTAWATVDLAVEAMRLGARDFFQKPWENARVLAIVRSQVQFLQSERRNGRLESENRLLRDGAAPEASDGAVVDRSAPMRAVLETVKRIAPSQASVLITGENGTGKGLIARLIHRGSDRAASPFVTVNIGGLNENLFQSELFGHVKGAFTDAKTDRAGRFEIAEGGTLFLDEIGNLPIPQQAQLLRTVETGEFERLGSSKTRRADVRLLAATNADLPAEVAAGRFRRDLYFRLNTVEIRLPALRERTEDLPELARFFLERHARRYRKAVTGFEPAAERALERHPWPGNVRELDHAVERAVLMTDARRIRAADLGLGSNDLGTDPPPLENLTLEQIERVLIEKALARYGGNATRAAEALGLSRSTFYRRLQQYGVDAGK